MAAPAGVSLPGVPLRESEDVELLRLAELEDGSGLLFPELEGMDIDGRPPDDEEDRLDGEGKLLDEALDGDGRPAAGMLDELLDDDGMLGEGNDGELELELELDEGIPGMDWLDDC